MASYWTAEQSRERAVRCLQLAEQTNLPKLRKVLMLEAEEWLKLAAQQERIENRAAQRRTNDWVGRGGSETRTYAQEVSVSRPDRRRAS